MSNRQSVRATHAELSAIRRWHQTGCDALPPGALATGNWFEHLALLANCLRVGGWALVSRTERIARTRLAVSGSRLAQVPDVFVRQRARVELNANAGVESLALKAPCLLPLTASTFYLQYMQQTVAQTSADAVAFSNWHCCWRGLRKLMHQKSIAGKAGCHGAM